MTTSSRVRLAALLVLAATLVASCGSSGEDSAQPRATAPSASDPLEATYVVTGVTEDGKPRSLVKGSEIRLAFADGQLRITAGCNSMSGAYRLDGTRLSVESLATTEMGCPQPLMEQDTWVAGLFADPVQLSTGTDAAIISGGVVLALADRETVSPDKKLVGTRWVLDTIGSSSDDESSSDGSASSVGQGVEAYVVLKADGTVDVHDGCNGGSGSAVVAGDTITWGQRSQTLIGCTDPAVEQTQDAFARVLEGETRFRIDEKTLTVTKGGRFLGFHAA